MISVPCRPHDIKFSIVCDLFGFFCNCIVLPDIKFGVAIRSKEYVIARPCWQLVGTFKVCDLFGCIIFKIIDPTGRWPCLLYSVFQFLNSRSTGVNTILEPSGESTPNSSINYWKWLLKASIHTDEKNIYHSFRRKRSCSPEKSICLLSGVQSRTTLSYPPLGGKLYTELYQVS